MFSHQALGRQTKSQLHLKRFLMKQWKLCIITNACPLRLYLLHFLCDKMESPHKVLLLPTLGPQLSPRKAPVQLFESQTELAVVFYMKCKMTNNCGYSVLGVWQTFSQKWMKWACHLKEKNWWHLLSMIKFEVSTKKRNILEHLYWPQAWQLPGT